MITSHTADFEPRLQTATGSNDPGPSTTATRLRVGFQTNFRIDAAYFFRLPALVPGETITAADFAVGVLADTAAGAMVPIHNADLVAIGFTNSDPPANAAAQSAAYYHVGEGALDVAPGRLLIQNNFLIPADFIPLGGTSVGHSTDAAGDASLLGYINQLYATAGVTGFTPGTSYLILRLNPDQPTVTGVATNTQRYSLTSAETTGDFLLPSLTLETTIIPEPASGSLLILSAAGLFLLRRRLRRVLPSSPGR